MVSGAHRSLFSIHCSTTFEVGILVWWLAYDTCYGEFSNLISPSSNGRVSSSYVCQLFDTVLCVASAIWSKSPVVYRRMLHRLLCYELTSNCYATVPSHWPDLYHANIVTFDIALVISEICWAIVIWIVKSSILVFYWRLFNARSRSLRVIIWALGAFVTCWGIALVSPRPSNFKLITTRNFELRR